MRSRTASLLWRGSGHWARGARMTKVSEMFGGIGSVAMSGVPVRENTSATSGSSAMRRSSCFCIAVDSLRLVLGIR
jgi:hypothetical protein